MSHQHTCRMCASPLATDQRYCVECGTRARPVPRWVAGALGLVRGDAPAPSSALATNSAAGTGSARVKLGPFVVPWSAPSPRAAAVSVLAVLSFGVAVGAAGISDAGSTLEILLGVGAHQDTVTQQLASVSTPSTAAQTTPQNQAGENSTSSPAQTSSTPANTTSTPSGSNTTSTPGTLPPIKHVWVITLGDAGYSQTFSPSSGDVYLSQTLPRKGELLATYYASAASDLASEVAMLSGQGPTEQLLDDCPTYSAFSSTKTTADQQVLGDGCVFPKQTETLFGQLEKAGYSWKTYVQGLGQAVAPTLTTSTSGTTSTTSTADTSPTTTTSTESTATTAETPTATDASAAQLQSLIAEFDPAAVAAQQRARRRRAARRRDRLQTTEASTCRHPTLGAKDGYAAASKRNGYVTWRNPAVYFASVTSSSACAKDDVGLTALKADLKAVASTPNVSFIFSDACDGGSDTACVTGAVSGTAQADKFLKKIVPEIMNSPAYKSGSGMILISFAEAPQSGPNASQASYQSPSYPNITTTSTTPTTTTATDATTTGTGTSSTAATDTGTTGTDTTTSGTDGTDTDTTSTATDTTGTTTTSSLFCTTANPTDANGNPCTGGGGQVGLLAISKCITPASTDVVDGGGNDFTLLATIENLFGLQYLGYAGTGLLTPLNAAFYNSYSKYTGLCGKSNSSSTG